MKTTLTRKLILFLSVFLILISMTACDVFDVVPGSISNSRGETVNSSPTQAESILTVRQPQDDIVPERQQTSLDLEQKLIQVYKNINPSVVYILTLTSSGSGFVYRDDGYIVTNNHVIEGAQTLEIVFASGERRRGELIGADPDSDLAVIKVDQLPEEAKAVPLATIELQVGQFVLAIGNPFGEQGSMSLGIVSGLGRSLPSQRGLTSGASSYRLPQVIQTDAPINPGNSGGPLLNLDGELVGINAAIATQTGTNSGVGFAIPVSAVARIVPSLIETGRYIYPYIGVGFGPELDLDAVSRLGVTQPWGAYVVSLIPDGPAQNSGLVAASLQTGRGGDLIIAIDGVQIRNFSDLNSYLVFQTSVGQTIEITVLRGGNELTIPLTLGARP